MKKFLKKSLLLVPLLLFFLYWEYNLSKISNSYSFKKESLEKRLDSIQVLVLGSSQVTYGVNPDYFKLKGFNLSNISQSLFYDTRLTLKYIDKMRNLKYVIINVSYFSFGFQLIDGIEKWRDYYYSQFWGINFPEIDKYDFKKYSKVFLYTPKIAFSYFQKGFHVNLVGNFASNGYLKIDSANSYHNISDTFGHQRVLCHTKYYKESRFKGNREDLELLVSELKKRNIKPVIVTPPVLPTYYNFADKSILEKNHRAINEICSKYKCDYFNYFTDKRFVKRDFWDNDHLNFIGAEKFSKIINEEILK